MDLDKLSPELKEKARSCESADELIKLANEAGVDLTDEELDSISGGVNWNCVARCQMNSYSG